MSPFPWFLPTQVFCRVNPFGSCLGLSLMWWIPLRRTDLSELGEAAAYLRRSEAELLLLQATAFDGQTCGACWLHFILLLLGGNCLISGEKPSVLEPNLFAWGAICLHEPLSSWGAQGVEGKDGSLQGRSGGLGGNPGPSPAYWALQEVFSSRSTPVWPQIKSFSEASSCG